MLYKIMWQNSSASSSFTIIRNPEFNNVAVYINSIKGQQASLLYNTK